MSSHKYLFRVAEADKAESSDEINKDDDILAFLTAQAQEKVGPPLADNVTKLITCLLKKTIDAL